MKAAELIRKALQTLPEQDRAAALKALSLLVTKVKDARSERAELKRLQGMLAKVSRAGLRRGVLR
jgi:hypothetical protein